MAPNASKYLTEIGRLLSSNRKGSESQFAVVLAARLSTRLTLGARWDGIKFGLISGLRFCRISHAVSLPSMVSDAQVEAYPSVHLLAGLLIQLVITSSATWSPSNEEAL